MGKLLWGILIYSLLISGSFSFSDQVCPPGDLNGDCRVTIEDLAEMATDWLGSSECAANVNGDDRVDIEDFSILCRNWQAKVGPVVINEFMAMNSYIPATNPLNIKTRVYGWDVNPDWIELYNMSDSPADIGGMYLTDDDNCLTKWRIPDGTVMASNGCLIVFASGKTAEEYPANYPYRDDFGALHTNFELSGDGEYLALVEADGVTISHAYGSEYPPQRGLVSYGISSAGTIGYLEAPTPGIIVSNRWSGGANAAAYAGQVSDTKFSVKRGFYETPFEVVVSCETPDAAIYFTTDSSEPIDINGNPTATAQLYSASNKPQITTTTCLRAAAIKPGWLSSDIDTQTYVFTEAVLDQAAPSGYAASWGGYPADYKMEDDAEDIKSVAGDSNYSVSQARAVIKEALLAIPTLSVVADPDGLFVLSTEGIYLNTTSEGINWERGCSAELFDPTEGSKFQLNCGIRIQGGASRMPHRSPKHSMSLRFRAGYGEGTLDHAIFPQSPVDRFNSLQLRAMYNNSWIHWDAGQRLRGSLIRDQWTRDLLLNMGNSSAGYGTYVHLYLNGLYWGVFNLHERQEAAHYSAHYGVDADTLDAISSGAAVDGNLNSWNALHTQVADAASDGNVSLTEYEAVGQKLDMVNLCDYMIMNQYGANQDWDHHNWRAAGGGVNNVPWRIYSWDAERILEGVTENVLGDNNAACPSRLFQNLRKSEEFRMLFVDRLHQYYFNGGALTAEAASQSWMTRANELDQAVIAESARWGDYKRDVYQSSSAPYYLYTRNDHWISEQNRLMDVYFTVSSGLNRSEQVLQNQYVAGGYYPAVDAPVFNINGLYQHGGYVNTNDILTMTNPDGSGTVYYTMDGSDPRLAGGAVNPLAREFQIGSSSTQEVTLVEKSSAVWKYLYDGSEQGSAWRQLSFSDTSWNSGPGELGFGDGDETTDIGPKVNGRRSAWFRHIFTVSEPSDITELTINLKYDDGAVIYINDQEVGRVNLPDGAIYYDTFANGAVENATATITGISPSILAAGLNILAVEMHQNQDRSSDMSFDLELVATESVSGGNPSQEVLTESTTVKARVLNGGSWSALNEAVYAVGPVSDSLRVSEIMFNPADPNTEYIELTNIGSQAINLSGVTFTRGVTYSFPSLSLAPGEYVLVVSNLTAFEAFYDTTGLKIAGQYTGQLNNDGEKIELKDILSTQIHLFDYSDNWYDMTDGGGFSLTIKDPAAADLALWDQKAGWRPSAASGGSPGTDDAGLLPPLGAIVINEVLAHSHAEAPDWIELHNTTANTIDISGWFLSDKNTDDPNIMKYEIPAGTQIDAGGYAVFYEHTSFGNPANANVPFALSEGGETVYLHSGVGGAVTGYVQEENFDASETGVTFGRYEKTELSGGYDFTRMLSPTPGTANSGPCVPAVVITEIHYNPPEGSDYEFVELYNRSGTAVTLMSEVTTEVSPGVFMTEDISWRLEGTGYELPAGVTINPGEHVIVAKNPAVYSALACDVYGPYDGKLDNGGEQIELQMPGDKEFGEDRYWIPLEKIEYDDAVPWPVSADGGGQSLHRLNVNAYGRDYSNWTANAPDPRNPTE